MASLGAELGARALLLNASMRTVHDVTRPLPCTSKSHCLVVVARLKFAALESTEGPA